MRKQEERGKRLSDLTPKEVGDRCITLERVTLGVVERGHEYKNVYIDHPVVKRVRFTTSVVEDWLNLHHGEIVDITVFPYEWAIRQSSGTVFYFVRAKLTDAQV